MIFRRSFDDFPQVRHGPNPVFPLHTYNPLPDVAMGNTGVRRTIVSKPTSQFPNLYTKKTNIAFVGTHQLAAAATLRTSSHRSRFSDTSNSQPTPWSPVPSSPYSVHTQVTQRIRSERELVASAFLLLSLISIAS